MMVGVNFEVRSTFEVVSPCLQAVHNGQELFLMDRIIELGRNKLARFKGNWVPMIILTELFQAAA
jgi:hypothetical protein